jgi:hypothetical protein
MGAVEIPSIKRDPSIPPSMEDMWRENFRICPVNQRQSLKDSIKTGVMMDTRESPGSKETCASCQKMLLKVNQSNVDEIVKKFNEDSTWGTLFSSRGSWRRRPEAGRMLWS